MRSETVAAAIDSTSEIARCYCRANAKRSHAEYTTEPMDDSPEADSDALLEIETGGAAGSADQNSMRTEDSHIWGSWHHVNARCFLSDRYRNQ